MPAGYYRPGKRPKVKPPQPGMVAPPRHIYTKAPRKIPSVPPSLPISEHAMASKNRTLRIDRSQRRVRVNKQYGKDWAARHSNFIAPGLKPPKPKAKKLSPGDAFAVRTYHIPLTKEGDRILATRGQRRALASARSAKRMKNALLADVRPVHGLMKFQPKNKLDAVPKPYSERQLGRIGIDGGLPGDLQRAHKILKIDKAVNDGKMSNLRAMALKQKLEDSHQKEYASLAAQGYVQRPGQGGYLGRILGETAHSLLSTPGALIMMGLHPIRGGKQLAKIPGQVKWDIEHTFDTKKGNPLMTALDLSMLVGGGEAMLTTGAKLAAGGRVLARGEGVGAALKATGKRPFSTPIEIKDKYGDTTTIPAPNRPLMSILYRQYRRHRAVSDYRFQRAVRANERMDRLVREGRPLVLMAKGEQLSTPEQLALAAADEKVHPMHYAQFHKKRIEEIRKEAAASGKKLTIKQRLEVRNHIKFAREWEQAANHVELVPKIGKNGKPLKRAKTLEVKGELKDFVNYIARSRQHREQILTEQGFMNPETLAARAKKPRAYLEETLGMKLPNLGEPHYVPHTTDVRALEPGRLGEWVNEKANVLGIRRAAPKSVSEQLTFENMRQGKRTKSTTKAHAKRELEAIKLEDWAVSTDREWRNGFKTIKPEEAHNYTAVVKGRLSNVDQAALDQLMMQGKSRTAAEALYKHTFIHNLTPEEALQLMKKRGVRFIPKNRAKALRPQRIFTAEGTKTAKVIDTINQSTVAGMLYLGSKYVVSNLPGQVWLAATSGALNPVNIGRAVYLQHEMGKFRVAGHAVYGKGTAEEAYLTARHATGAGMIKSLSYAKKDATTLPGKIGQKILHIPDVYAKIIDDPFRWLSFTYNAKRRGYATAHDIHELMTSDEKNIVIDRRAILQDANRDLIDYDNMNHIERDIIRRAILFYPWLKGSTVYGFRWLGRHPVQAGLQIHLGQQENKRMHSILGNVPSWMESVVPIGYENVPGLGRVPKIVDPTAASIVTQPVELMRDLASITQKTKTLGQYLSPAIQNFITLTTGFNPSRGQVLSGDTPIDQAVNFWQGNIPALQAIRRMLGKRRTDVLYPRSTMEQIMRTFVIGGLYPGPVNPTRSTEYYTKELVANMDRTQRVNYYMGRYEHDLQQGLAKSKHKLTPAQQKAVQKTINIYHIRWLAAAGKTGTDKSLAELEVAHKFKRVNDDQYAQIKKMLKSKNTKTVAKVSTILSKAFNTELLSKVNKLAGVKGYPSIR